jgi:hypothetical protein
MGKIGYSRCPFEIWAPSYRTHAENVAFTLYAMDQERNMELSMAINTLAAYPEQCSDEDFQNEVFIACGIDSLAESEYEFILNTVAEILEG